MISFSTIFHTRVHSDSNRFSIYADLEKMSKSVKAQTDDCDSKLSHKTDQLKQEIEERKKANKALKAEIKERKKAIKLLKRELAERKQIEDALYFVAQRGWKVSRAEYFQSAMTFLAKNLGMEYAFIGEVVEKKKDTARTIVLYVQGEIVENVEYSLKRTPSENVIGQQLCCYPKDVQKIFPQDELLAKWQVESYIGSPLWDSKGKPLGLIALMGQKPLFKSNHAETLLQILAVRAAQELEQNQSETILTHYQSYLEDLVEKRTAEALKLSKSEKELKHYQNYLEELVEQRTAETTKLSRAIEQSPVSVIITDTEGHIEYVNPTFTEATHYTQAEVIGQTLRILQPEYTDSTVYQEIWETIRDGKEWRGESCNQKKNGDIFYESTSISAIKNPRGEITNYIAVQVDITDHKKTEWELEKAKLIAEGANRTKSEFLANMSHEIRTPLNAILGFSALLEKDLQGSQEREYLHSIRASGKSLLTLINDVLDLSKIEAGKLDLKYTAFNPYLLFQEIQRIFSYKIVQKQLEFQVAVDPEIPSALILDEIRLRQILLNLVGNAFKFTETGIIRLSVHKQHQYQGQHKIGLIFSIEDTGIGIPDDQIKVIFGAFEQQHRQNHAKYGGTGLGLAITKRLVEMMGGHIFVESRVGIGSKFNVIFKAVAVATSSDMDVLEPDTIESDMNSHRPATILAKGNREISQKFENSIPPAAEKEEESLQSLDAATLAKLPELLNLLENESNDWQRLGQTSIIQDIQTFAVRMQKLGEQYRFPVLQQWGEKLYSQVFNIETFPKTLEQFPNLVNRIRDQVSAQEDTKMNHSLKTDDIPQEVE